MNEVLRARVHAGVVLRDGCWVWSGPLTASGYARASIGNRPTRVHRAAYQEWCGPIPDGTVLDHLCRNRAYVNPAHLEAVSQQENVQRGAAADLSVRRYPRTHCPHGHAFTVDNSYFCKRGTRSCRACRRMRSSGVQPGPGRAVTA